MSNLDDAKQNTQSTLDRLEALKQGCCLVAVTVRGCCGEKSLNSKKIIIDGQQIESKLMRGTSFNWFPQEHLTFKGNAARAVERLLASLGVKVAGGATLLPVSRLDELHDGINDIEERFYDKLSKVVKDFDQLMAGHVAENQEVEELIREYSWNKEQFEKSFIFKASPPLAFAPADEGDADEVIEETIGLVYEDVAKMASDVYTKSFFEPLPGGSKKLREKIKQSVINSGIDRLMSKLTSLSFLDPSIGNIVDAARAELAKLPKAGYIEGEDFARLQHFVLALGNEDMIRSFAEGHAPLFTFDPTSEADPISEAQEQSVAPVALDLFEVLETGDINQQDDLDSWGAGL
ncbi:hypothetical protein IC617_08010 [Neiella sp. HB171785]|uniref:DUF3150 domain-containing protein n=1 Tax=Neiella litorisoli TaxID=2771431 RepID=A0A8J6QIM7_9GAMM|nr:DUF3150 domain-containing protein [Neiella litorisoli]MBD1389367.1 hypothetical protein [Neiella litorisoli]